MKTSLRGKKNKIYFIMQKKKKMKRKEKKDKLYISVSSISYEKKKCFLFVRKIFSLYANSHALT